MDRVTDEFIRTFEKIKAEVNRRAGDLSSFDFEVEKASRRDGFVRKNRQLLVYVRDIRNALQHPKHRSNGAAIQVTESFLAEVQALLRHLENPPNANSVGVPRCRIMIANLSDKLGDLADQMRQKGYSHLPILDEQDAVVGVFNEAAVFDHLWAEPETIIAKDMQVADIFPHCRLDAGHTETFRFVKPRTPMEQLMEMFVAVQSPSSRVGAAFVTASGKPTEPLQRMITPWDVLASTP